MFAQNEECTDKIFPAEIYVKTCLQKFEIFLSFREQFLTKKLMAKVFNLTLIPYFFFHTALTHFRGKF